MLDILSDELERSFEPQALRQLAIDGLGFDPAELASSSTTSGSLAAALVQRCASLDAIEALCDIVIAARPASEARLRALRADGSSQGEGLAAWDRLGDFTVDAELGRGPSAAVAVARAKKRRVRLRALYRRVATQRTAVERYLAVTRLAASSGHDRLPKALSAVDIAGRPVVVQDYVPGEPLSSRLRGQEAAQLRVVWPMLRNVLETLASLHMRRLAHGALKPENVLIVEQSDDAEIVLLDAGAHFLLPPLDRIAPEQCLGETTTPRTDVYAFGVLLYTVLAGKSPFPGTARQRAAARFRSDFEPLSFVCPRGWVPSELDDLILAMLDADPEQRPADAEAVLDALETIRSLSGRRDSIFPQDELQMHVATLLEYPERESAAAILEAAVDQGADRKSVADAFRQAADKIAPDAPNADAARRRLLARSGALYESLAEEKESAEQSYRALLELDSSETDAWTALERIYRRTSRYEALCELLVRRAEITPSGREQSEILGRLGNVLATKIGDRSQALLAYAHAWIQDPSNRDFMLRVEEYAGTDETAWKDVLSNCQEHVEADPSASPSPDLLLTMGRWYVTRLGQQELALRCFQAILIKDPKHAAALIETAAILRRNQQWRELESVLVQAASAVSGPQRREMLYEAARVLEENNEDPAGATRLYEQLFNEDASDDRAGANLCRLLLARSDGEGARSVFERRLKQNPLNLDALNGIARVYEAAEDYPALLSVLEKQAELTPTPRARIALLEEIAYLYERQFLDPDQAIAALERLLSLDPAYDKALESLCRLYRKAQRWPSLASILHRQIEQLTDDSRRTAKMLELGRLLSNELNDARLAIDIYEKVLTTDPGNREALGAIASLRGAVGDAKAADALVALANRAEKPQERADLWARAGDLLQAKGDLTGAIDHYRRALAEAPHRNAARQLRKALILRGDVSIVVQMLEKDLAAADTDDLKVETAVELARVLFDFQKDARRARAVAGRALEIDPANMHAHVLLGDIEAEAGHTNEALRYYALPARQADTLPPADAIRVIAGHADALGRSGDTTAASKAIDRLLDRYAEHRTAWLRAMELSAAYGSPDRTLRISQKIQTRWDVQLSDKERARALSLGGDSLRKLDREDEAIERLESAIALDAGATAAFEALAAIHRARKNWGGLGHVLQRWLPNTVGADRARLLVEVGDLYASIFADASAAAQNYRAALEILPGDRRVLLKLVQLYTERRDWQRLIDVLLTLVDCTEDKVQKSKYLQMAARVADVELEDASRAMELLDRAISFDGSEDAIRQGVALRGRLGDKAGIVRLLEQQIARAAQGQDRIRAARLAGELADMHLADLDATHAISITEAILHIDPENRDREDLLVELYATDATRYVDRAVTLLQRKLARDPSQPGVYQSLCGMYERAGRADAAWCASQALVALDRATPEQVAFFESRRAVEAVSRPQSASDLDVKAIDHPSLDPALTRLFAEIEPVVVAARGTPIDRLGLSPADVLNLDTTSSVLLSTVKRAATLFGMPLPLLLKSEKARQSIAFGRSRPPALIVGASSVDAELPALPTAFVVGAHLAYYRRGFYVRTLVPTAIGLKSWVLAALKLIAPRFPCPLELEGPVNEALQLLQDGLSANGRERLAAPVDELLQHSQRLDLNRWLAAVDLTSDRAGFLACDDLPTVFGIVRATGKTTTAISVEERERELLKFAVSPEYIAFHAKIGRRERLPSAPTQPSMQRVSLRASAPPKPRARTSRPPAI